MGIKLIATLAEGVDQSTGATQSMTSISLLHDSANLTREG